MKTISVKADILLVNVRPWHPLSHITVRTLSSCHYERRLPPQVLLYVKKKPAQAISVGGRPCRQEGVFSARRTDNMSTVPAELLLLSDQVIFSGGRWCSSSVSTGRRSCLSTRCGGDMTVQCWLRGFYCLVMLVAAGSTRLQDMSAGRGLPQRT